MNKWLIISLGAVLGISHIGMIGLLSNRESKLPSLDIPVGPYTSYQAEVSKEGYRINYKANDPKTMFITKDIKKKGGFLGLANNIEKVTEEYTMDGAVHNKSGSITQLPVVNQKHVSKQSEVQKEQEDLWVLVLVLVLLLLCLIFPLLVGLLLVG